MNNGKKDTLTEVWLQKIKNNRIVAVLIIVSVVVAGIATFTESAKKIYQAFFLSQVTESKDITIPVSNIEIKVLPVTVNKEALIRPHAVSFEMRNGGKLFQHSHHEFSYV